MNRIMKSVKILVLVSAGLIYGFSLFGQSNYELLFLKGEFEQILTDSREFKTPEDHYWHAAVLSRQGKAIEAIRILENGIGSYIENKQIEILLSELYFNNGQYPKAKALLVKHIDYPGNFMRFIELLEFERDYNEVIARINERINDDPDNIQYLVHLGGNYYQIDSTATAIGYYEKAFTLNPHDQVTAQKLANIYLKIKEYDRILEICEFILLNDSLNKSFIRLKGMASFNRDDFETSIECFNYLMLEGDSSEFILKHLGISELNNRQWHIAREHLLIAFRLDSTDFETCFFLGKSFLNSPKQLAGLYYLERADSLLQPDPKVLSVIWVEKQSIYAALHQYSEALECYEKAFNLNPKPEYLYYMASLYEYGLKEKKKALEQYELFLSKLPPKPDSDHEFEESQVTLSLRKVAEEKISSLREE